MRVFLKCAVVALLAVLPCASWAGESTLVEFNLSSYDDWYYNRSDVELNAESISHQRVKLFRTSNGIDLTLTSPVFDCNGLDSIAVDVEYVVTQGVENYAKLPLTIMFIDEESTVGTVTQGVEKNSLVNQLSASFTVAASQSKGQIRLMALKADTGSNASVRSVVVTGFSHNLTGDVNGDGVVDITDVNALVNAIAAGVSAEINTDVNGDGVTDITDVNAVINMLLLGR